MFGPSCGDAIAQWVVKGRPDTSLFDYDIRRFHRPMFADKEWVRERVHETYAKTYSIVYPHDDPLSGRGRRKSPLHKVKND